MKPLPRIGEPGVAATPVLPLSPPAAALCREAFAALRSPALRAAALRRERLPVPVVRVLRLLSDRGLARGAERVGRAARGRLLRRLRDRHPEGMAALRAAWAGPARAAGPQETIIVSVFTTMVVMTVGTAGALDDPFAGLA